MCIGFADLEFLYVKIKKGGWFKKQKYVHKIDNI